MNSQPTFLFLTYFNSMNYGHNIKRITLALGIFEVFLRILLIMNLSLNQTLLTYLLYVNQTWMTQFILANSL